jgi:hypothetical protein
MSAPDAVDGSYSGIAMYQVAVVNQERSSSSLIALARVAE